MSDGGPRWNVGRGSLRNSKSRSSATRMCGSKGKGSQEVLVETEVETEINVDGPNQAPPQRAPVDAIEVPAVSSSRSRRSDSKTGHGSEDDTLPRDLRSRQDKLPRSTRSKVPQERGTMDSEEQGKDKQKLSWNDVKKFFREVGELSNMRDHLQDQS